MYRLELKYKVETAIGRLNMDVHAKSRPRSTVLFSLKNINAVTRAEVH